MVPPWTGRAGATPAILRRFEEPLVEVGVGSHGEVLGDPHGEFIDEIRLVRAELAAWRRTLGPDPTSNR